MFCSAAQKQRHLPSPRSYFAIGTKSPSLYGSMSFTTIAFTTPRKLGTYTSAPVLPPSSTPVTSSARCIWGAAKAGRGRISANLRERPGTVYSTSRTRTLPSGCSFSNGTFFQPRTSSVYQPLSCGTPKAARYKSPSWYAWSSGPTAAQPLNSRPRRSKTKHQPVNSGPRDPAPSSYRNST